MKYQILPSLLSADLTSLGDEVLAVKTAGADLVHFDVMDNHYVPTLTFGPLLCEALHQRFPDLPIDVHLMTIPTDDLIHQFASAGASRLSIHPDATIHLDRSLHLIRELGCEAGVVLNPSTSPECIEWCLSRLDFVLIMTVNPGFGGQKLIPAVIDKIKWIHFKYPYLPLCIDGGVTIDNINLLAKAGATQFVAGTTIFKSDDYGQTITNLRDQLEHV
jgi:ribulose-phosphate 3-epimerase